MLTTDGKTLTKRGMGGQDIAKWEKGKIVITAVSDVKSTESILKYMRKSIPKLNFAKEEAEVDEKKVPKLKFKLKQFKHLKPKKKKKGRATAGGFTKYSDTSKGFSFLKSKGSSGYVGAYNSYMPEAAVLQITDVDQWTTEIYK